MHNTVGAKRESHDTTSQCLVFASVKPLLSFRRISFCALFHQAGAEHFWQLAIDRNLCTVFKRKFCPRHKRLEATPQSATFITTSYLMLVWFVWNLLNERALRHRRKCKVLWNAEYLYLNIQYGYMSRTLNLTGTLIDLMEQAVKIDVIDLSPYWIIAWM